MSNEYYAISVNGRNFLVRMLSRVNGALQVEVNGTPYLVQVEAHSATRAAFASQGTAPTMLAQRHTTIAPAPGTAQLNEGTVIAPIPGIVASISVKVGQQVSAGETLLVIEAMKMENNLTAPFSGIVHEILISVGSEVQLGAPVAVIMCS